jgi:hypothetical protein
LRKYYTNITINLYKIKVFHLHSLIFIDFIYFIYYLLIILFYYYMLIDTLVLQQYSYIYKKLLNQTNLFKLSKREKKKNKFLK